MTLDELVIELQCTLRDAPKVKFFVRSTDLTTSSRSQLHEQGVFRERWLIYSIRANSVAVGGVGSETYRQAGQ